MNTNIVRNKSKWIKEGKTKTRTDCCSYSERNVTSRGYVHLWVCSDPTSSTVFPEASWKSLFLCDGMTPVILKQWETKPARLLFWNRNKWNRFSAFVISFKMPPKCTITFTGELHFTDDPMVHHLLRLVHFDSWIQHQMCFTDSWTFSPRPS